MFALFLFDPLVILALAAKDAYQVGPHDCTGSIEKFLEKYFYKYFFNF
jgi:hypothetical protein